MSTTFRTDEHGPAPRNPRTGEPLSVLLSFPTRLGVAGIGMIAWHQAAGLAARGVDVSLACGSVERPVPGARTVLESMRIGRTRVPYRVVGEDRALAWHDRLTARLVAGTGRRFDVIHAWPAGAARTLAAGRASGAVALLERPNTHYAFGAEAVQRESERLGVRVDQSSPHVMTQLRMKREIAEYASGDGLLCPSDFVARSHLAQGEAEHRIHRHRYGHDPRRFRSGEHPRNRRFTVLFAGRGEVRKGLHVALEAWLNSPAAERGRFVICGAVDPDYRRALSRQLAHPAVEERGFVADPGEVMREADVLVLPSFEEGSALVTYEGRASGCVLAVSDRAGAVCRHEIEGLIHPAGDVDALRGHLERLEGDPATMTRLRTASLASVDELTWDAAARTLHEVYVEALARAGAPRAACIPAA